MTAGRSRSIPAQRYLSELESALAEAPAPVRTELVADITGELDGLTDEQAQAKIAELGDPRAIAADATAQLRSMNPEPAPSKVYPTVTAIVLTAGWYLTPVVGWVAGLVMIGVGTRWTVRVRRRAILASVAAVALATLVLLVFRGTDFWPVGLTAFLVVPLLGNIYVSSYLRSRWGSVV